MAKTKPRSEPNDDGSNDSPNTSVADLSRLKALGEELVRAGLTAGADAADAVAINSVSIGTSYRLGKLEDVERSESCDVGLRVFVGKRQAVVSSTDFSEATLKPLVEQAVAIARAAPEDPHCGLADRARLATSFPELDLVDPHEPSVDDLIKHAATAEEAALAVSGVTNSEGASAGWGSAAIVLATSDDFCEGYASTNHSISCSVIAGEGTGMERDYDFTSARHAGDLEDAATVGRRAGEQTVQRLNPRKVPSQSVPVIYDPRVSNGLIGHFAGAISGQSVARGTSFLKDRLNEQIFAEGVTIVDDPHRLRGMRSRPFDGEGVANTCMNLIENGVLTTWLLDTSSARQLGLSTTGHASRGIAGSPSPGTTNLYMVAGSMTPEALMADIKEGLYIRELIGMGVSGVTGDYSRGAGGFWIENGKLTDPVSELTVAGNLKDMYRQLTPANDLTFRYGINAPTVRIDGMMIAGT